MKPRSNPLLRSAVLATSFVLTLGQVAQAATYYWNTNSDSWALGANWSDSTSGGTTGVVPSAADNVIFNQSSVNGAEIISLNGNQSITGITFNNTGTSAIVPGTAGIITPAILTLGTGGISIASGAGAVTLNAASKLDGSQSWINNSKTNPFTVSSTITNVGDLAPYTLTIDGAGATRLNGIISNGGATGTTSLMKSGLGTLTIGTATGVANTFAGGTTINANSGTVIVTNAATAGLGTGAISIGSGSTLQYNTSTRGTTNSISNVFTGSGTLKFYSSPYAAATGFTLGNNLSGFNGTIQVTNNGVNGSDGSKLNIGSGTFNASGANLIIDSGSQLFYAGTTNTATFAAISVSGNGGNEGRGALRIESGTLAGPITLTGNSAWGQAGGSISGSITGTATSTNTQTLTIGTVSQSGGGTLSGVISDGTGGGKLALTKRNTGTLNLTGAAANTYTGDTTVNGGILLVNLNALTTPTDLISSSSKLVLGGGNISITGKSAAVASSQSFASTTLNSGNNSATTALGTGGTSTTLALQAITRNTGALFNNTNAPNTTTLITTTTGINGAALPVSTSYIGAWATNGSTTGTRYLQLNSSGQFVTMPTSTPFVTTAGDANTVYNLNGNKTITGNLTGYGWLQTAASIVSIGNNNVTLNGFININASASSFTRGVSDTGTIIVGAENELVVNMAAGNTLTVSVPIVNKASSNSNLTLGGTGGLILNTAASTYTGTTTVNSGTLTLGLANVINSASNLVMNGGTVSISTFDQSFAGMKVTGGAAISGTTGIITSASTYDIQRSGTISAILAGSSGLDKTTDFNATLSGANTFTGNVNIKAGQLSIATASNPTPLGNTANNVYLGDSSGIDYATLSFNNTINLANPITVQSGSSGAKMIAATSGTGTVSGNVTLNDDLYLWTNGGGLTLSGSSINLNSKALKITQGTGAFALSGTVTGAAGSIDIVGANTGTSIFSSTESTYGGGTVLGGASTTVQIDASSTGSVTKGPFGTGTVSLNGSAVNAGITADQTIANAIIIAENTTFANQANEKSLTFSGATTLANGDRTLTVNLGTSVAGKGVTFSNAIGDSGQGLGIIKAGTGLLTLSGSNTYGGQTAVTGGILAIANQNALGNSTQISVGTGTGSLASLRIDVPDATSTTIGAGKTVVIRGNGFANFGALLGGDSIASTWAGNVVIGDASISRIGGGISGTLTVSGVISGNDVNSGVLFSRAANSTTILTNVNTYTGDTQFFMGGSTTTLKMGIANAINSGSRLVLGSATTGTGYFDLNGHNQHIRALSDTVAGDVVVTNSSLTNDAELKLSTTTSETFNGWIQDGAAKKTSLVVAGTGTQTLSGSNTYTGNTTITGGTLALTGSGGIADSAIIDVRSGSKFNVTGVTTSATIGASTAQTLKGLGTVEIGSKILNIGANGTLAPGASLGTLTFDVATGGALNFASGSDIAFELGTTGSGNSDIITFSSAGDWLQGTANATLALTLLSGFDYSNTYTIFENVTTTGFTLAGVTGYDKVGYTHTFAQSGNNYQLSFAPVPETSTTLLSLLGSLALLRRRRRN